MYDVGVRAVVTLIAAAGLLSATEIPKGTSLQIRLSTAINTSTAKPKQAFEAMLIAPVVIGGTVALAAGHVPKARRPGLHDQVSQPRAQA